MDHRVRRLRGVVHLLDPQAAARDPVAVPVAALRPPHVQQQERHVSLRWAGIPPSGRLRTGERPVSTLQIGRQLDRGERLQWSVMR